ncbi:MAG: 3-deoxy-8-phosphooctulonate synthase [Candidatus Eisenbacteria bacterium]|nr:3-deoxy-8-phosphooctulonate synthase [Candidatus Eisenbacteria bacterium]
MDSGQPRSASLLPEEAPRPFVIAGPCVLEGQEMALEIAERLRGWTRDRGLPYVFKTSYRKANRTAPDSPEGPGLDAGLRILQRVRQEIGVPVLTDVHSVEEAAAAGAVVDVLQIPAFLCRQTDLIRAAAQASAVLNVKKGQFLAMDDIAHAVEKARAANPAAEIWLTERGSFFGYHDLVVDMRAIAHMRSLPVRVVFDATHSLQHPGRGGDRRFARPLARAALGAGAEGIFAEVHPDPSRALSDASTQLPLASVPALLDEWAAIGEVVRPWERRGSDALTAYVAGERSPRATRSGEE